MPCLASLYTAVTTRPTAELALYLALLSSTAPSEQLPIPAMLVQVQFVF